MSGGFPIDSLGYGYNNLYNDPAFWAAASTPNVNQLAFQRNAANYVQQDTTTNVPVGQPTVVQTQPEKKSNTWKWVLGTAAAAVGTAYLAKKGILGDGTKNLFEKASTSAKSLIGKESETAKEGIEAVTARNATVNKVGENIIVKVPGHKNFIAGKEAAAEFAAIGEKCPQKGFKALFDKEGKLLQNNSLEYFTKTYTNNNHILSCNAGGNFTILDAATKKDITQTVLKDQKDLYNKYADFVSQVIEGKIKISDAKLDRFLIKDTNATSGLSTRIRFAANGKSYKGEIADAVTEKFSLSNPQLNKIRNDNKELDNLLKFFETGGGKEANIQNTGIFTTDKDGNILQTITHKNVS